MSREELEKMKHAINQYHIQNRKDYSENRKSVMGEEREKRREAFELVRQIKIEKDQRMIRERTRIQKLIESKQEAYRDANMSLNTLRRQAAIFNDD